MDCCALHFRHKLRVGQKRKIESYIAEQLHEKLNSNIEIVAVKRSPDMINVLVDREEDHSRQLKTT
jgi:hypothetical protein